MRGEKALEIMQSELLLSAEEKEIGFLTAAIVDKDTADTFFEWATINKHYWRTLWDRTHLEWHSGTLDLKTKIITPREYIIKL